MAFRKKMKFGVLAVLLVYVGCYAVLSANGEYRYAQSGQLRLGHVLAVPDESAWQPLGCRYQRKFKNMLGEYESRGNTLGLFFSPLIILDRQFVHQTEKIFELD